MQSVVTPVVRAPKFPPTARERVAIAIPEAQRNMTLNATTPVVGEPVVPDTQDLCPDADPSDTEKHDTNKSVACLRDTVFVTKRTVTRRHPLASRAAASIVTSSVKTPMVSMLTQDSRYSGDEARDTTTQNNLARATRCNSKPSHLKESKDFARNPARLSHSTKCMTRRAKPQATPGPRERSETDKSQASTREATPLQAIHREASQCKAKLNHATSRYP
jgi:hypothetical protein